MRLSIKGKLSISISCALLIVLLLHMVLNYYTTKDKLIEEMEARMEVITQQISISMRQSQYADHVVEDLLAEKLHMASIYAASRLPTDIRDITNEQLKQISHEVGISQVSLLQKTEDGQDIVIRRSSDPAEIGMSTKGWGFWFTAFQQLLEYKQVWIAEGRGQKHFWTGPFDISTSNPSHIDKWGYYYDGKRNYIINPFIQDTAGIQSSFQLTKPDKIIEQTIDKQLNVLEITAFNPEAFGKPPIITKRVNGIRYVRSQDQPILYGSYKYAEVEDYERVAQVIEDGHSLFVESNIKGEAVVKSYITATEGRNPYIMTVVMDAKPLLDTLHEQLMQSIAIGLVLLELVLVGSYFLAGFLIRPLQYIVQKVNMMAIGQFNTTLRIKRNDELGVLASRINLMADNLYQSTERLRTLYEENRAMKHHLESFINQSTDAIHVTDLHGDVERVNQAFVDMFGWKEHEVLGKKLPTIPSELSKPYVEIEESLSSGKAGGAQETLRMTKDGRILDVSVSTSPILDESGQCMAWASITRDITSRKRMEELLRRSEKLTTVGQLAAGVAHEIRNPLTTLKGFIQLQLQTSKVNPVHTSMMLSELERINLIVGEFLILSKPQAVRFQEMNIGQVLHDVLSFLGNHAQMHNIEFVTKFQDVPLVLCEENQLKQVFINIVKNGIEAMPEGGEMDISVDQYAEEQVRITIRDYGIGIPEDHLTRLGDPFFTNKEKGTGLGLMVCQRIIYNHKGTLEITSKLHEGTMVTIKLPAADVTAYKINEERAYIKIR
ncbi:ATP-binding protein [Paenibacillus sp. ACRRX]|uniref:ATP-binding protein n=1 Tax=Paenibacillus sp. ACRRX TaxID=2918206 RepID=UPI001EF74F5F|nr:ATP-binding protein [Paenibacillus sp. ACRRX]MCG7410682.1 ATP-binding protein [Paenibacillus sp. ACRRX]